MEKEDYVQQAWQYEAKGRYLTAHGSFDKASELDPDNVDYKFYAATMIFRHALQTPFEKAFIIHETDYLEWAKKLFLAILETHPDHKLAQKHVGYCNKHILRIKALKP